MSEVFDSAVSGEQFAVKRTVFFSVVESFLEKKASGTQL